MNIAVGRRLRRREGFMEVDNVSLKCVVVEWLFSCGMIFFSEFFLYYEIGLLFILIFQVYIKGKQVMVTNREPLKTNMTNYDHLETSIIHCNPLNTYDTLQPFEQV